MKFRVYQFLLCCISALFFVSEARIGDAPKEVSPDEDRDLAYYGNNNNYNNNNNNRRYYGGGGGGNGGGGRYYYGRRYYRQYYNQNNNGSNENAGDDTVDADDNEVETYYNETDDTGNATDYDSDFSAWRGYISSLESEAEVKFYEWYQAPPGEWTTEQWAWFSGILTLTLGLLFCICMCCTSCCESEKEVNREGTAYDFDDYTSIDSRKGSFMTKGSESTDFDDNATYDSIMRLRSD